MSPGVSRSIYFTAAVGNEPEQHELKTRLRNFGLEPHVLVEKKSLADKRENKRLNQRSIEKAKQVDIALTVRMMEDSRFEAFDAYYLYTSDVDFAPVIKAVMARGKHVFVFGYRNGLSQQSELLHVPDQFVDLENMLRTECEPIPSDPGTGTGG